MIKCKLKLRMVEKDMTVLGLCEMTGLTPRTISFLRSNRISRFHASVLDKLCEALDCQAGDLLEYIPDTQKRS